MACFVLGACLVVVALLIESAMAAMSIARMHRDLEARMDRDDPGWRGED